jgi:hypothetical protein
VKQIGEDAHVARLQRAQPCRGVAEPVEHIRLVAIQRLIEQRDVVPRRVLAELVERITTDG